MDDKTKKYKLLNKLDQYDYFVVRDGTNLLNNDKKGVWQVTIYDNAKLHWNDSVFKFWRDDGIEMYFQADIDNYSFKKIDSYTDELEIHIIDCLKIIKIKCCNRNPK